MRRLMYTRLRHCVEVHNWIPLLVPRRPCHGDIGILVVERFECFVGDANLSLFGYFAGQMILATCNLGPCVWSMASAALQILMAEEFTPSSGQAISVYPFS